jgi:hypothetical protein
MLSGHSKAHVLFARSCAPSLMKQPLQVSWDRRVFCELCVFVGLVRCTILQYIDCTERVGQVQVHALFVRHTPLV